MTALPILFGFLFTIAAALGFGGLLVRRIAPSLTSGQSVFFGFLTGSAVLSILVFSLCAAGLAYPLIFLVVGGGAILTGLRPPWPRPNFSWYFFVFAAFGTLYFFHAMAPEISPDGIGYHLGLVGRILREHGFHRIETNFYSSLPQGMEMLFLVAYAFGQHSAAALVHFAFLVALAAGIVLYGRRSGVTAAAFVFLSPVVGLDGSSCYNDVGLAVILLASFYALELWERQPGSGLLLIAGLLAGFAFSIKYTGIVGLLYAIGFVFSKRRSWKPVGFVFSMALIGILPWLAKNWILAGNPFAPFGNAFFPNPFIHLSFEQAYTAAQRDYHLASMWDIPRALTITGELTGILGPLFLLSPLALLAARKAEGRRVLLAGFVFGLPWLANHGSRFLIPAMPFIALALAMVVNQIRGLAPTLVVAHALISWPGFIQKRLLPATSWSFSHVETKAALRITPETVFLQQRLYEYPHARLIQDLTPPGSKILSAGNTAEAYTTREVLVSFQSAWNESAWDLIRVATDPDQAPTHRYGFVFSPRSLNHLRLETTGPIYELHFPIPSEPNWRVTAFPQPWDAHWVLDGNPATRWRIWQPPAPGMYLEVNFGRTLQIDHVAVDTNTPVRLALIDATPEVTVLPAVNLRRAAIAALKQRGIGYLLAQDSEALAPDFRQNAALWGMHQLGSANHARLYQFD